MKMVDKMLTVDKAFKFNNAVGFIILWAKQVAFILSQKFETEVSVN